MPHPARPGKHRAAGRCPVIARFRAWLGRSGPTPATPADVLAARDTRIAQLEAQLSKEQLLTAGLTSDFVRQDGRITALRLKVDVAEAEAARLRADKTYVTAERCECGGDTELYWRTRAHEQERQARQDRDNARRAADQVEYWRQRVDAAEHQAHIAEQLGRVR